MVTQTIPRSVRAVDGVLLAGEQRGEPQKNGRRCVTSLPAAGSGAQQPEDAAINAVARGDDLKMRKTNTCDEFP
jgi:hypothetical protein